MLSNTKIYIHIYIYIIRQLLHVAKTIVFLSTRVNVLWRTYLSIALAHVPGEVKNIVKQSLEQSGRQDKTYEELLFFG